MSSPETPGGEKGFYIKEELSLEARIFVERWRQELKDIFEEKGITSPEEIKKDTFTDEEREIIEKYQKDIRHVLKTGKLPPEIVREIEEAEKGVSFYLPYTTYSKFFSNNKNSEKKIFPLSLLPINKKYVDNLKNYTSDIYKFNKKNRI